MFAMGNRFKKPEPGIGWRHSWRAKMAEDPCGQDRHVREAFLLILRRVEACNANILPNTGREGTERFVTPVLNVAQLWPRWQRAACSWSPQATVPREQFRELANHLLASYPVPRFMYSVFEEPGYGRYREWFAHVGAGRNIRTAPRMTAALTSRMAHYVMQAPDSYSVVGAVRWGQVLGLGGKPPLAKAVIETSLGRQLDVAVEELFWLTYLQWLVNNPELPRNQVGPLVDFLAARRRREPEFSLKGRTPGSLRQLMEEWHRELRRAPGIGYRPLPRSGFTPCWVWVDGRGNVWTVDEIADTFALREEGEAMHHCVFSYASAALAGQCSLWSMKVERLGQRERALTFEVRNATKKVVQARGLQNRMPTSEEQLVLARWTHENGLRSGI